MDSFIKKFVDIAMSGGRGDVLLAAEAVLLNVNSSDYALEIETIFSLSDTVETEVTIERVEDCIRQALRNLISDYGVGLKTLDLKVMPNILMGLIKIPEYEDTATVSSICHEAGTPEEKLAEILTLVVGGDETDYLTAFDYVNAMLIQRIVERYELQEIVAVPEQEVEEESTAEDFSLVKRFIHKHQPAGILSLLDDGWQFGFKYDTYLKALIDPEDRDVAKLAVTYLSSALAAGEHPDVVMETAGDRIHEYIDDILVVQRVVQKARNMLNEVVIDEQA